MTLIGKTKGWGMKKSRENGLLSPHVPRQVYILVSARANSQEWGRRPQSFEHTTIA